MYYDYETRQKVAAAFIERREEVAALYPAIKKVIQRFDGKVFNKRLTTAIQEEVQKNIYSRVCGSTIEIYYYIHGDSMTLLHVPLDKLKDGKRIDASIFIESLTEYRNKRLQEADHMRQIMPTVETRYKQIEYIETLIKGITGDLTSAEKQIFNLYLRLEKR